MDARQRAVNAFMAKSQLGRNLHIEQQADGGVSIEWHSPVAEHPSVVDYISETEALFLLDWLTALYG